MRKLRYSLVACMLVFTMMFMTCATSFAAVFTDEEIAYVQGVVDDVTAEIQNIIDIAKNGTVEEKETKIDEYINAVKEALVVAGIGESKIDEAVALIEAEISEIVSIAISGESVETKVDEYITYVKSLFDLSAEENDCVDGIIEDVKAEVEEIVDIVENKDKEAAEEKINAYIDFIKETLDMSDEDEAQIAELVADITALVEEIQGASPEEIKATVDAYIAEFQAKIGHKHYEKTADSRYVAIGGYTVFGTGLNLVGGEKTYPSLIDSSCKAIVNVNDYGKLLPSGASALIDASKADIEQADLITYQLDASSFIDAMLSGTPDWDNYFDAEAQAVIGEVWAQTQAVLTADWETEGIAFATDAVAKIKEAVLANVPEEITIEDADVQAVIDFCMPYIERVLAYAESKKDAAIDAVSGLDAAVLDYAEKLAYAVVSYAVDTKKAIEEIQAINPDATLVVVGMYNPARGLKIETATGVIDAEEYVEYLIDATNIYYTALAVANGGFAFVDVSDATINGFGDETVSLDAIKANAGTLYPMMHANAAGHTYIKEQIITAITCDYSVYEQLDSKMHTVKCSICGDADTEAHSFSGTTCTKCDYVKSGSGSTPPTGPTGPSSGGVSKVTYTITFNTNGGSKIDSVKVAEGKTLLAPKAPVKEGYIFDGWYTDSNLTQKYNFSTPVTKAFTLYAKWIESEKIGLKFTDIKNDAWYYDVVKTIVEKGLMNGISDTQFAPELEVTRAMFVTILYRAAGEPQVAATTSFADVSADAYYAKAVAWANANGIVNGITESEFAPDNNITREQMAAILHRYAKNETVEGEITYTDKAAISDYALDAINWAYAAGIMQGNEDGSFAPLRNSSRAEAAAVFVRLLG